MRQRGSIFKRCDHKRQAWPKCAHAWTVVVTTGKNSDGKPIQVWRSVKGSLAEAERERTLLLHGHDAGTAASPAGRRTTLAEYLQDWLEHMKTRIRPTTWERYRSLLDNHVYPRIGEVRLGQLKPRDVQRVLDEMLSAGAAPRSVVQCYRVLSSSLSQAVRWQMIATNPAAAVQPPRPSRPTLQVPDAKAVAKLLEASKGTTMELPVMLAVSTGMRRGELCGLRWADIDETPEGTVARVTGTLQRIDGTLQRVDPKTDRARRVVALPSQLVELLNRHRKAQAERRLAFGSDWADNDLILERGDGRPQDPDTLTHQFGKFATAAGVTGVRLHDLRHAYATSLLRWGVHPKIVSEALGHSSSAFTMDTYSHVVPSMQRAAADAMEAELG